MESLRKLWKWLRSPHPRYGLATIFIVGGLAGVIFWGGFNTFMEYTNTLGFCASCHEMRDYVFEEYKTKSHYSNASGVQATCADCHVPKGWVHKLARKVQATNELYYWAIGAVDTPEKFEARRIDMARNVWRQMKAADSRECRNCHSYASMNFEKQKPESAKRMKEGLAKGETCIDCHKGIVHKLPDLTATYQAMMVKLVAASASLSPKPGDTLYSLKMMNFTTEKPGDGVATAGRLLAATPMTVLARDGERLNVRISGWRQENVDRVIFALQGKRIFVATLVPAAANSVKAGKTVTDPDTGQVWTEAALDIWIAARDLTNDQKKLWEYGAELYTATCDACHAASPTGHYRANEWIGTLDGMKQFISLDEEQHRFLQKYLQMHASDIVARH